MNFKELRYYYSGLSYNERVLVTKMFDGLCEGRTEFDYDMTSVDIDKVAHFLRCDCPELYFADLDRFAYTSKMIRLSEKKPIIYGSEERAYFQQRFDKVVRELDYGADHFSRLLAVHDYLAKNVYYDKCYSSYPDNSRNHEAIHSMLGPLVNGAGVCSGISKAAQYMLMRLGVRSVYMTGTSRSPGSTAPGPHGWLAVDLGGKFCHVDISNDICGTMSSGNVDYTYLCLTDSELLFDHTVDRKYCPSLACNSPELNYHRRIGHYFTSLTDLAAAISSSALKCNTASFSYDFRLPSPLSETELRSLVEKILADLRFRKASWSRSLQPCYRLKLEG